MKKLPLLLSTLILSSSLLISDTISLTPGWNLLGTGDKQIDINATFATKDVSLVWGYRNLQKEWIATSPNGTLSSAIVTSSIDNFESVPPHMGYWVKNNSTTSEEIALHYLGSDSSDSTINNITIFNDNGTLTFNNVVYGTILSEITQRVWLDRNLGASQSCTAFDDIACYGDYYQWGRNADGHEKTESNSVNEAPATGIEYAGSSFNINPFEPYDWTILDSDGMIRSENWSKIDGSSICPVGFRVPTKDELLAEEINDNLEAFNKLMLPTAGLVSYETGELYNNGTWGFIPSSTVNGSRYLGIRFLANRGYWASEFRAQGTPVRCIQDETISDNTDTTDYPQVWTGITSVSVPDTVSSCSWDIRFTLNENNSGSAAAILTSFTGEGSTECDSFSSNTGSVSNYTDTSLSFNIDSTSSDYIFGGNIFNLTINGSTATETMSFTIDGYQGIRTTSMSK